MYIFLGGTYFEVLDFVTFTLQSDSTSLKKSIKILTLFYLFFWKRKKTKQISLIGESMEIILVKERHFLISSKKIDREKVYKPSEKNGMWSLIVCDL